MAKARPIIGGAIALLLGLSGEALAGGLALTEHGAAATGKANAFAGEANDPSALFYNPAGITQLPGTQVMIGASIIYLDSTFRSSTTGESTQLQDQFPLVPHLYITHRFKGLDERLSIGLGIFSPFGIVIDWPDNWQGRFDSTNAKLRVTIYQPTVAFQATKDLSLAAGLRIADVAAEFERQINVGNGESTLRAHDLTANPIGWNVALLFHVTDTTSVGLLFKSAIQAKLDGSADFSSPASALFSNTGFHSSIKLPPQLVVGVSTKFIPRWTFNADIEWEGWRTVGALPLNFDTTPASVFPQSALNAPGPRQWTNSYVFRVGGEFAATDRIAIRGGYFYDQTPIPDNTFDPNIPNANLHALTTGLGYKWNATSLDVAYLIGFYEKRTIDASSIDPFNSAGTMAFGSYSTMPHVLTISLTQKF
jgi:long-chain fatty acid transport protein